MQEKQLQTMDTYIAQHTPKVQKLLTTIRKTIKKLAPQAEEAISYQIPTFKLYGNLVHFAAFSHHIGFYPGASGIAKFQKQLSKYKNAKGSVQFPIDEPLPLELIEKITAFRIKENTQKAHAKAVKKVCTRGHTFNKSAITPVCPKCWPGKYKK